MSKSVNNKNAVAIITLFAVFLSFLAFTAALSLNTSLRKETVEKLSCQTTKEGMIIDAASTVLLAPGTADDVRGKIVESPKALSALIGTRVTNPAYPDHYTRNISSYIDQTSGLRSTLWDILAVDRNRDGVGESVKITVDSQLTSKIYELIETSRFSDTNVAVVVLENKTGAIYTLVSYKKGIPFNANDLPAMYDQYHIDEVEGFFLPEYSTAEPPGSTFKVVSAIPIIEAKLDEELFYDPGYITVQGQTIRNFAGASYGNITLEDALKHSVNTYFSTAFSSASWLPAQKLQEISARFCIGTNTYHTDTIGTPSSFDFQTVFECAQAAFGQGKTLITPIQLASCLGAVMNNGKMVAPHLVESCVYSGTSKEFYHHEKAVLSEVASKKTCETLKTYLQNNAEEYGMTFATAAKSGTAERGEGKPNALYMLAANNTYSVCVRSIGNNAFYGKDLAPIVDEILSYPELNVSE